MLLFVLGYIAFAWYSMNRVKITKEEIGASGAHNY